MMPHMLFVCCYRSFFGEEDSNVWDGARVREIEARGEIDNNSDPKSDKQ